MTDVPPAGAPCVWLRLDRPLPRAMAIGLAVTLEEAVLERFERLVAGGNPAAIPPALRRAGATGDDGPQAQWLPLPDGPGPGAGIGGACVRLPPGTASHIVVGVAVAAGAVDELVVAGPAGAVRLRLFDGTPAPAWTTPAHWQGPARRFRSVFPIAHGTTDGDATEADVRRWCAEIDLPEPDRVTVRPVDPPIGLTLAIPEGIAPGPPTGDLAACEVELAFGAAVPGPFAIGPGRRHGPGLMVPVVL